ncbi:helix-turn-helix domain-containing protein [Chryseobacterium vrystaatense]|uniref:Transcriptional regulator n=1 Tax=Chryseobacterium vrystaatense TaxID=307480 RepID=A0ABR4UGY7_9FLAO|nr:helix-turn-helix domain-containing protein [Chryseobacterium vrystaatense]KFF23903.1 transcriptional regulator [Chryseobacterium vrystaatense]
MSDTDMQNKKIHQGRNIKRFREMMGIKQEAMAFELGEEWNQKKVSLLEQKETVESDIVKLVARILKVPAEAIENFDEEQAVNVIASTINNHDQSAVIQYNPTFFPVEKLIQLHEEKIMLYERMLKEKEEMMARLENLFEKK